MKQLLINICFILFLQNLACSQNITYSAAAKGYKINIIGRVGHNIMLLKETAPLLFKRYLVVFNDSLQIKQEISLDNIPKTAHILGPVIYTNYFYIVYEFNKYNTAYCASDKFDVEGNLLKSEILVDTAKTNIFIGNRVYGLATSEDKRHILIYKKLKSSDSLRLETCMLDSNFNITAKRKGSIAFKENKESCDNYLIDNDGNFAFIKSRESGYGKNKNQLTLVTESPSSDILTEHNIPLNEKFIAQILLTADNLNKHYIINSFYCNKNKEDFDGIFFDVWNYQKDSNCLSGFTPVDTTTTSVENTTSKMQGTLSDFSIQSVTLKKDGGFIISAEKRFKHPIFSNNLLNRPGDDGPGDVLVNSMWRDMYYDNLLVTNFDKTGAIQWSRIITKNQTKNPENTGDQYLSYSSFVVKGEIHYLYNQDMELKDKSLNMQGTLKPNVSLNFNEKEFLLLPRFAKQIGSRKIIMPCSSFFNNREYSIALIEY